MDSKGDKPVPLSTVSSSQEIPLENSGSRERLEFALAESVQKQKHNTKRRTSSNFDANDPVPVGVVDYCVLVGEGAEAKRGPHLFSTHF